MKAATLFFSFFLVFVLLGQAQQTAAPKARGTVSLQQQFNGLKFRSSSYKEFNQDYKVVRLNSLEAFWKNVQDSLNAREQNIRKAGKATEQALTQARKDLAIQKAEIETLKQANARKELQIRKTEHDVASLSVFGLDINKQVYVIISWIIILGLLVMAGVFSFLYKKSKLVTDEKIKAFDQINQEYNSHKQSARERELKIKRDLQTEANRVAELNQEIALLKKQVQM